MTKALIDGDIIVYRVGFTTLDDPVGIAISRTDALLDTILVGSGTTENTIFLTSTDKSNFRYRIYPEYKANRKAPKPTWYEEIRAYLVSDWNAEVVFGMEADDAIGIAQNEDTVICSIDKDLDQIPGKHYDIVKKVAYEVSEENSIRFFYYQALVGDSTDNIPGCKGIGPVKANEALEGLATHEQFEKRCLEYYQKSYGNESGLQKLITYGQCLKIKRKENESLWLPSVGELKPEENVASSKP